MAAFTINLSDVSTSELQWACATVVKGGSRNSILGDLLMNIRSELEGRLAGDSIQGLLNELTKYSNFCLPFYVTQKTYNRMSDAAVRLYEAELLLSLAGLLLFPVIDPMGMCFEAQIKRLSDSNSINFPPHGERPEVDALRERAERAMKEALTALALSVEENIQREALAELQRKGLITHARKFENGEPVYEAAPEFKRLGVRMTFDKPMPKSKTQ